MLFGQSLRHQLPLMTAPLHVPAAHLGEQNVDEIQLGDAGGHGAQLQGTLEGAALEHHVHQGGAGGAGVTGMLLACRCRATCRTSIRSLVEPE